MSGFVRELAGRTEALDYVSKTLGFPWRLETQTKTLGESFGRRIGVPLSSLSDYPPFSRSTRDGYALRSQDIAGASDSAPVFLRIKGEVLMGEPSDACVNEGECLGVHTGGMIPEGSDAVVMLEDTLKAGDWLEVRKSLQSGENVIFKGEEIGKGQMILETGERLDQRNVGILATLGICEADLMNLRIGILSTGDEIVPAETRKLPSGKIRDANSWFLEYLLSEHGFSSSRLGIAPDRKDDLEKAVREGLVRHEVLLISGGSSVSVRDYCSEILEGLPSPGLLVRGINMSPGKPVLIAGCLPERRLVVGLPGHPLSCSIVALTVLLPLLYALAGTRGTPLKSHRFPLARDIFGRTGVEEFIPVLVSEGKAVPLPGKSGYVSILREAVGLVRLPQNEETRRKGETVEVLEW
jgi:molybdopterin molybdotransferase